MRYLTGLVLFAAFVSTTNAQMPQDRAAFKRAWIGLTPTLAAVKLVAEAARKGEGNLRYDVVQSVKPPLSHMTLFAAWQSRKDFDAYEKSAYGRRFRDTVGPLLGSPFDDRLYATIN